MRSTSAKCKARHLHVCDRLYVLLTPLKWSSTYSYAPPLAQADARPCCPRKCTRSGASSDAALPPSESFPSWPFFKVWYAVCLKDENVARSDRGT